MLTSEFSCDCSSYWFWRRARDRRVPAWRALRRRHARSTECRPRRLVCGLPAPEVVAARAAGGGGARVAAGSVPHAGGVRAVCPPAPPALLRRADLRALVLDGAGLRALPARLPPRLDYLDVNNNSISRATAEEGAALFRSARRVRLTNNPLACDCNPHSILPILRAHTDQVENLNMTRCSDGRGVLEALAQECEDAGAGAGSRPTRSTGALAALLVAAAAAAAVALTVILSRPELRMQIKAWLHARGCRGCWISRKREAGDDGRIFDVFVSYAPHDERFVAESIVPFLEKHGYVVCVKYREWPPGAWIPTQIELSVHASRRTLSVYSAAWGADGDAWAAAELRAAHAAALRERRPRLVLLLLAPLPEDLASLARAHTVLHWYRRAAGPGPAPGAACWDRLLYALPPPADRADPAPVKY
ncbi:hypothetical protein evm_003291 [Chilo suppressalis]|nr:hypothetical protein evm_003291 [Chilo suppressalis]